MQILVSTISNLKTIFLLLFRKLKENMLLAFCTGSIPKNAIIIMENRKVDALALI
jgi:hypothetical protein